MALNRFKKDEIELIRSCSKIGYCIVGGFDKLIQYFIKKYEPEKLVSYVDRRYFNGNGYKKWNLIHETKPNYWYWKKNNSNLYLESRMKYQKHKLKDLLENFDESLTEAENMANNGYLRIYDCGNLKFEMRL